MGKSPLKCSDGGVRYTVFRENQSIRAGVMAKPSGRLSLPPALPSSPPLFLALAVFGVYARRRQSHEPERLHQREAQAAEIRGGELKPQKGG
jgi:hypothetical protein